MREKFAEGASAVKAVSCDLYRHFDDSGQLLYVGISLSPLIRLAAHKSQSHWFGQIARITIERFATIEKAASAETRAIAVEKPLYNKTGHHTRRAWYLKEPSECTHAECLKALSKVVPDHRDRPAFLARKLALEEGRA